jgi:hypothetical protein
MQQKTLEATGSKWLEQKGSLHSGAGLSCLPAAQPDAAQKKDQEAAGLIRMFQQSSEKQQHNRRMKDQNSIELMHAKCSTKHNCCQCSQV